MDVRAGVRGCMIFKWAQRSRRLVAMRVGEDGGGRARPARERAETDDEIGAGQWQQSVRRALTHSQIPRIRSSYIRQVQAGPRLLCKSSSLPHPGHPHHPGHIASSLHHTQTAVAVETTRDSRRCVHFSARPRTNPPPFPAINLSQRRHSTTPTLPRTLAIDDGRHRLCIAPSKV